MAFGTSAAANSPTNNATVTVTKPASVEVGDLLLLAITADDAAVTVTWPTGFAHVTGSPLDNPTGGDAQTLLVGWKIADGTEGATLVSTLSVSANWCAIAARYTGRHQTTPIDSVSSNSVGTQNIASPVSIQSTTLTPGTNFCDIVVIASGSPDVAATTEVHAPPNGYTEREDEPNGDWSGLSLSDMTQGAAVATGVLTVTATISGGSTQSDGWTIFTVALRSRGKKTSLCC